MNNLRSITALVVLAAVVASAFAAPACVQTNNRRAIDVEDGSAINGKYQASSFGPVHHF